MGWVRVTVTEMAACAGGGGAGGAGAFEVLEGGGLGGRRVEARFTSRSAEVDLLGTGACSACGHAAGCLVDGDDLTAVVGHASDEHQRGGNHRDKAVILPFARRVASCATAPEPVDDLNRGSR